MGLLLEKSSGLTLLELLLTVAIMAVISGVGFGYYHNYTKSVQLEASFKTMVSDLKNAQNRAMTGEDGLKWGVHFANGTDDYYELFSTASNYASGTVKSAVYLPAGIAFSDPVESGSEDIIFNKINGTTTTADITVTAYGQSKTVNVSAVGSIY